MDVLDIIYHFNFNNDDDYIIINEIMNRQFKYYNKEKEKINYFYHSLFNNDENEKNNKNENIKKDDYIWNLLFLQINNI